MPIPALRTPDDRFHALPDFPFAPHYVDDLPGREGLRLHYVDEGPADASRVFLCLHGQPSWSYLYRKMIPIFAASGARVIAPDLFGFGRSDKPTEDGVYTFDFHRDTLIAFIERLDLRGITLTVQDWGGLLGLTLPHAMPDRIARLLVMNTTIADGRPAGPGFDAWRAYNRTQPDLNVGALMSRAIAGLTEAEAAAYAAPFPDAAHKAGVRRFPDLVMTDPGMEGVETSRAARAWLAKDWAGDSFMAVGMQDPVLGPEVMEDLRATIRNCPPAMQIPEGGHFVQEHGAQIARAALAAWGDASAA
jgi:pimeloyl-ACP methyl ester carboxylesterase